ncbi:hypothetical protein [Algoriella sp.]|uniref:hypothetical protein n=1 Tax=Algoriella sp. TaxID=1872434 RepID=UPI002FC6B3D7
MKPFLIDYFIDRESFIDLQIDFLKQDFFYSMNQDDLPPFKRILLTDDFSISEQIPLPYSEDPNGISYDTHNIFFYKTFLPAKIERISHNFLEDFYNYIREELLEDQKERRKFLDKQKKRVASVIDNIDEFNFIDFRLFTELKSQLCQIEIAINSPTLYNDKYIGADRIKLEGWNKIDMIALFYFLRQERAIENVSDIKLGHFIERFFCIEENDKFQELAEINKKISGIKKQDVTISKSTERIRKFFKNIDLKPE